MFDLNNVTVLTKAQQKNIRGGEVKCAYATSWNSETLTCIVYGGASAAEFMASPSGYWECGTSRVNEGC